MDLVKTNQTPPSMVLRIDPVVARALSKILAPNTSLVSLDLCGVGIQDDVGIELGRALGSNGTLQKLELDYNKLGPKSLAAIAEGMRSNPSCALRCLSLERNPLTKRSLTSATSASSAPVAAASAGAGSASPAIRSPGGPSTGPSLGNVGAGSGMGAAVSAGQRQPSGPDSANASGSTDFDIAALTAFTEVLRNNDTLLSLNLFAVGLGAAGGRLLSSALRDNTTLVSLQVSPADGVRPADLSALTDIIRDNTRIAAERAASGKSQRAQERRAAAAQRKEQEEAALLAAESTWLTAQKEAREKARVQAEYEEAAAARRAELERESKEKERRQKAKAEAEAKAAKKAKAAAKKKKK
jgi:hypothetical protein